nr:hypothetical protein [Oscillospiraceae bacterium]
MKKLARKALSLFLALVMLSGELSYLPLSAAHAEGETATTLEQATDTAPKEAETADTEPTDAAPAETAPAETEAADTDAAAAEAPTGQPEGDTAEQTPDEPPGSAVAAPALELLGGETGGGVEGGQTETPVESPAIPVLEDPSGDGLVLTLTQQGAECALTLTEAGLYALEVNGLTGKTYYGSVCVYNDAEEAVSESLWIDVRWGEYDYALYFSVEEAGEYTVRFDEFYFTGMYADVKTHSWFDLEESACSLSVKAYRTVPAPVFDTGDAVNEDGYFQEPFYLKFADVPEGWGVRYRFVDEYESYDGRPSQEEPDYALYVPAEPPLITGSCTVEAYCEKGAAKSESVSKRFSADMETPTFGTTENEFSEPFALSFQGIPADCSVYYAIVENDCNLSEDPPEEQDYQLYQESGTPVIVAKPTVAWAYYVKAMGNGTQMKGDAVSVRYSPDMDQPVPSVKGGMFYEPFALEFEAVPADHVLYYAIVKDAGRGKEQESAEPVFVQYDAQQRPTIDSTCDVYAYYTRQTEKGVTMQSETMNQYYSYEIEHA